MDSEFQAAYHVQEGAHWWSVARRDMIVRLLDRAGVPRDARILDVGCASGRLIEQLRDRGHPFVTGVDVSSEAMAACRARGLEDVHQMPADALALDDASFDVLIASDVLEHIDDDLAALKEWRRVVKPGGLVIIFVPAHMFLWSHHDVVNHHHRRYDREELAARVREAGWSLERVSGWNLALLPPAAAVRGVRRLRGDNDEPHHDLEMPPPWMNRVLIGLLRAENRALAARDLHPGISLFAVARRPS